MVSIRPQEVAAESDQPDHDRVDDHPLGAAVAEVAERPARISAIAMFGGVDIIVP